MFFPSRTLNDWRVDCRGRGRPPARRRCCSGSGVAMRVERFPTPEPPKLRICVPSGRVQLETADVAETTSRWPARRRTRRGSCSHGNEVVIEIGQKALRLRGDCSVHIRAPHGSQVDANVASADVEGRGRFGESR